MIREIWQIITEIFYPIGCLQCLKTITDRGALCPVCRSILREARFFTGRLYECRYLDGFFIFYRYEKGIRKALLEAKFFHKKNYVHRLAKEMLYLEYAKLATVWHLPDNVVVTPIPTDRARAKARGFELPQEIFRPWCRKENLKWRLCLERQKKSEPQFGLTKQQRKKNVKDCWRVCEKVTGLNILLVDDIFTTGATTDEAARCLKEAGATKVYAIALASGKR